MKIIHIMADGNTRESVEGMVIRSRDFYRVLDGILTRKEKIKEENTYAERRCDY